jgi:hypothetical protein
MVITEAATIDTIHLAGEREPRRLRSTSTKGPTTVKTIAESLTPSLRALLVRQHDDMADQLGHTCHVDPNRRKSAAASLKPALVPAVRARLLTQHHSLADTLGLDCSPESDFANSPGGRLRHREPKDQGVADYRASGSASVQQPGMLGPQLQFERPYGEAARRRSGVITESTPSLLEEFLPTPTGTLTEDAGDATRYLGDPHVDSRRKRWAVAKALQPFLGEDSASHQLEYYQAQPLGEMAMDAAQRRVHARTLADALEGALPHGGKLL